MTIQLFTPSFRIDECLSEIRECLEKGWTGLGFKTLEFESAWKQYTGLQNAHFLSSNTVGLHLALHVLKKRRNWEDGDEVITTPITFVSTNHAILYERLNPVFADVDASGCLDPESIERRITAKTRAVMFVGLGGNVGQYDAVLKLCRERNIALVLDAAHMAGTRDRTHRHVGHDADVTVFSFQAVKNLPTADSGMICFADETLDVYARKMSWMGINKDTYARTASQGAYKWMYDVEDVGFKYHGNSIMAAMGLVQLKYLDRDNAFRRTVSAWYDSEFGGAPNVRRVAMNPECESSRHLYQVRVSNRDELLLALNGSDIYPGVHYRDNTHYAMFKMGDGNCPSARSFSDTVLSLPLHLGLSRQDVRHVAQAVRQYAK